MDRFFLVGYVEERLWWFIQSPNIGNHVEGMVSGGWDSQNDSGSGKLKSLERVALAILWPQKGPRSCELRLAPVAS